MHIHFNTAGVYRINVGPAFLVSSSDDITGSATHHGVHLAAGLHNNRALQEAWNQHGSFEVAVLETVTPKPDEPEADLLARLRFREQAALDVLFGTPGCCNESESAYHQSTIVSVAEPRLSERRVRAGVKRMLGQATREAMSAAKRGDLNPNARACRLIFGDINAVFPTVTAAADFFGVTQQTMQNWLSGKHKWPKRGRYFHLAGLTGAFLGDPIPEPRGVANMNARLTPIRPRKKKPVT